MSNKVTQVLEIDANISSLENKLKSMKGLLSGVLGSAQAPKGLEKSFEKIGGLLDKIKAKAEQPLDSNTGFASIKKDVISANAALNNMVKIVESINSLSEDTRISFLSPEKQKEIQAIVSSLEVFANAIIASTKETKELVEAREKLAKAEASVVAIQQRLTTLNADLDTTKKEKKATEEAIAGIEERKKKLAELKKQQEEIEKFYNTPNKDGTKRNRSQKYADVAMRPQDIKKKITGLETSMVGDEEQLSRLREELKKVNGSVDSYLGRIGTAERELVAAKRAQEELSTAVTKAQSAFDSGAIEQQQKAFSDLREKAKQLGISLEGISENYSPDDAEKLTAKFIELKNRGLDQVTSATTEFVQAAKETGEAIGGLTKEVDESAESFKNMTDAAREQEAFESKIKQFLGMAGAAQVLRSALRSAMNTIKELDATMTEMSVVTDLGVGDYWDQLPEYTKRANELGLAINDVYKADTLFYQQGLKTNEVVELSTETMKMAKIAGLDTAEATDRMTAALRGFNMELDKANAQKISDVYSELAAITAADVEEISSAMTKTASIASSAGMEFETTAAFLSQIIETTRESAETAGTAMKTVIARFQELKKAPDEIGEIDGEIVDANAIETALRSVGVSLRDAGGQFRELDDVFLELSSKWSTLDKNTQRYIATIAAGSRQQSRFLAMMSDYGRTQELVTAANNSAGASARQYEKTVDSLETKLNKLKNAWDEFAMGILESDLVKAGVEILTKFLEVINKATSAFDGLGGSIAKIMTVLMVFKLGSKLFEKLKKPLMDVFDWAVSMASPKGYEAGKKFGEEFARGSKEAIEAAEKSDKEKPKEKKEEQPKSEEQKTGIGATIAQKSGWTDINEGRKKRKRGRELSERYTKAEAAIKGRQVATAEVDKAIKEFGPDSKEYEQAYQKLIKADQECRENVNLTQEELDELATVGKEGTEQMAKGFAKMGEAAIGAGVGVSMLGGLLSSLGSSMSISWLEELGEGISAVGNSIAMVGTTITAIIPIITLLSKVIEKGGQSAQAAWWWAIGIVVAVAALIVGIIAIVNIVKNASPEAKLERAQEAADKAAEAADQAAESYENLANSFDELEDKYKTLEELTQGTKEWNKAVQEINNSVLDLVQEYPELAKLVSKENGVLTLDTDSAEVQAVLQQKNTQSVLAKNFANAMSVEVAKAQEDVELDKVDDSARLKYDYSTTTGIATQASRDRGISSDKDAEITTEKIARALASGDAGTDELDLRNYLIDELKMTENAAREVAKSMWKDVDDLRAYGESINNAEARQEAVFSAIAMSAQSLANTLTMSDEQIQQSSNLVDDTVVKEFYDEKLAELDSLDTGNHGSGDNDDYNGYRDTIEEAVKKQYGSSARLGKGGQITFRNSEGADVTTTLTATEIKSMIATQYATERSSTAIEYSDEAVSKLSTTLGKQINNKKGAKSAIDAIYMANNGGALTKADLRILENANVEDLWKSLDNNEKLAYGNNIDNLKKDFEEAINGATKVLKDETKIVFDYMTSDMAAGFNTKLDNVISKAGGEAAKAEIKTKTENLLSRHSEELQQEIQTLINATDWANLESLKGLQIELQNSYGYSEEEASNYVKTLGKAAYATSSLTTTIETFGEFYQANQKVEDSLRRISDLQREYNNALEDGKEITTEMLQAQAAEYRKLAQGYEERYTASTTNLEKIGAQGYDKTQFGTYNLWDYVSVRENGSLDTSKGARGLGLQDLLGSNIPGDLKEKIEKWVEDYNTEWETQQESLDGLKDAADDIRDLEAQGKEAYYELRDMVKETVLDKIQKQIDIQQDTLDATRTANQNLVNKIQEQIDTTRQEKQNQEAEENIANLRSQAAYLSMDTSGSNALQLAQLEEQTKQAEEDYLNTRIDQSIQSLQDANAKAEEQRERQIVLAEQQLAAYQNSPEFQSTVDSMLKELQMADDWRKTTIGDLMYQKFTEGLSGGEAGDWQTGITNKITQANEWGEGTLGGLTESINEKLDLLPQNLANKIVEGTDAKALTNQVTNLRSKGLNDEALSSLGVKVGEDGTITGTSGAVSSESRGKLDTVSQWLTGEDSGGTTSSSKEYLTDKGIEYQSKEEYYAENIDKIASGEEVATYENYLGNLANQYKAEDEMLAMINNGGVGLRGMKELLNDATFDKYLDAYEQKNGKKEAEKLKQRIAKQIHTGALNDVKVKEAGSENHNGIWYTVVDISGGGMNEITRACIRAKGADPIDTEAKRVIEELVGGSPSEGWMCMLNGEPYIYWDDAWRIFENNPNSKGANMDHDTAEAKKHLSERYLAALRAYKTGGIADFTGPAWLDGTPSKPEYVLNSAQTERFFSLIDVLEKYDTDDKKKSSSGDNYFDIEINVEKLENDYDVEKLANKIRSMIYNDATYRNVNAINHIR